MSVEPATMADLLRDIGCVAPERVRMRPGPGTATEADVHSIYAREKRLFELIDGILVEKVMGLRESLIAGVLIELLRRFVVPRNLGIVSGEAGMMRLFPGLVRIPDVAYVSWARIPGGVIPSEPIPNLVPDLAIEVLSTGNSPEEMLKKRNEYFSAGVILVWEIDPVARTLTRYTDAQTAHTFSAENAIAGEPVLNGFNFRLSELFAELDRRAPSA